MQKQAEKVTFRYRDKTLTLSDLRKIVELAIEYDNEDALNVLLALLRKEIRNYVKHNADELFVVLVKNISVDKKTKCVEITTVSNEVFEFCSAADIDRAITNGAEILAEVLSDEVVDFLVALKTNSPDAIDYFPLQSFVVALVAKYKKPELVELNGAWLLKRVALSLAANEVNGIFIDASNVVGFSLDWGRIVDVFGVKKVVNAKNVEFDVGKDVLIVDGVKFKLSFVEDTFERIGATLSDLDFQLMSTSKGELLHVEWRGIHFVVAPLVKQ